MFSCARLGRITHFTSFSGMPQAFQVIEFACGFGKHMHHEIQVVHQNPFAFPLAFDV